MTGPLNKKYLVSLSVQNLDLNYHPPMNRDFINTPVLISKFFFQILLGHCGIWTIFLLMLNLKPFRRELICAQALLLTKIYVPSTMS